MIVYGGDYEHTLQIGQTEQDRKAGIVYQTRAGYHDVLLNRGDFEVSECSLANYMLYRGNDDHWLTAIPVFPIRAFRHGSIFVRKDSGLRNFSQLGGRKIGVKEYSQTLAVWVRAIMKDEHRVDWRDINWVSLKQQRFPPPVEAKVTTTDRDLEELLADGEIDALVMEPLKDWQLPPEKQRFRALIDDPQDVERRYFERTGIFPIRHTVVMRSEVLAREPAIARAIFDAYVSAKKAALQRGLGATYLPWGEQIWRRSKSIFGTDSHPYGLTGANRKQIEMLAGYLLDQGFIPRPLDVDTLFVPGSTAWRE